MQHSATTFFPDGNALDALYTELVLSRKLYFQEQANWPAIAIGNDLADLGERVARRYSRHSDDHLLDVVGGPEGLLRVSFSEGMVNVQVAATTAGHAARLIENLRVAIPASEPDECSVPLTFWTYSQHGPRSLSRTIDVPSWPDIEGNYPASVRRELNLILDGGFRPAQGGQLILWHGEPGTGKTWALRALAWEWREWAEVHYITDPERLFGNHSDYMLDVLLDSDGILTIPDAPAKWKLLLLEDTGELLTADAKERTGQALSRLLNVVDGIIGQGLRVLVLVTTNEKLGRLHPAVARPGRCAAQVEFQPFSADEALEWLREVGGDALLRECDELPRCPQTLAELYAIYDDRATTSKPLVGFVR